MTDHFDDRAATWDDDPAKVERAQRIAGIIDERLHLGPEDAVMEYGAGTGLVAQFLAPKVGPITLAEPSAGMRQVASEKVAAGTLPPGTRVWDLDLATASPPEERFDLIATSLVLHHIVDLDPVLKGFATLLAPGGALAIADLDPDDGGFHNHSDEFSGHNGFDHDELRGQLEAVGFSDIEFSPCGAVHKDGNAYQMFLATARTAVES